MSNTTNHFKERCYSLFLRHSVSWINEKANNDIFSFETPLHTWDEFYFSLEAGGVDWLADFLLQMFIWP